MNFFLMGGTGFIGIPLIRHLIKKGHNVTALARTSLKAEYLPPGANAVTGDPLKPGAWQKSAGDADVIINLVGRPIMTRWTRTAKKEILDSRIISTRMAVRAIPDRRAHRMTLINANAVGYYEGSGDTLITEKSPPGKGFLAEVCRHWQKEAEVANAMGTRTIIARLGAVLGPEGGMLAQMLPVFRLGIGGRLGSGRQWFSWIHMHDLTACMLFVAENTKMSGVINICSPNPVTNRELTGTLADILNRPAMLPVPAHVLRLILGGSAEIALRGQRVIPAVLEKAGFAFSFPTLKEALESLTGEW